MVRAKGCPLRAQRFYSGLLEDFQRQALIENVIGSLIFVSCRGMLVSDIQQSLVKVTCDLLAK